MQEMMQEGQLMQGNAPGGWADEFQRGPVGGGAAPSMTRGPMWSQEFHQQQLPQWGRRPMPGMHQQGPPQSFAQEFQSQQQNQWVDDFDAMRLRVRLFLPQTNKIVPRKKERVVPFRTLGAHRK